jgi:polyisoprenoid-binding protein YceI
MTSLTLHTSAALLALSISAPAWELSAAPPPAPAPIWVVDRANSRLGFAASMNGQAINGQFRRWAAQIRFDPAHLDASSVRATIDMASAATGDATRDEALPTDDWFSAKLFPQAQFVSRHFSALPGGRYQVQGDLRIRNVVRPVSFPFKLTITGGTARMVGAVPIDRTVFGVGQGQWKGTEAVAAKVDVLISIAASKAP